MKVKKLLSLFLALVMLFTLAACNSSAGQPDDTGKNPVSDNTQGNTPDNADVEMPSYKIGILYHTNSGGCWERMMDAANYMADELNLDIVTAVGGNADAIISEVENFIAAGVDAVIIGNDGGVTSRLVDICSDAGVYIAFSDCGLSVVEEDDYSTYATNEYYLGHVAHDEYADSYACAKMMIENGAKNFVIFGLPPGISSNFDKRAVGAADAIKEAGLEYVEARSYSMAEMGNTLMSQYPDTDAIFSFVTTPDNFNVVDMASKYGGKLQISAYMVGDVSYEFDVGFLTHVSVGSEARLQVTMALVYSALRGGRIGNEDGTPAEILFPHLWITSGEDFEAFYNATNNGNHAYSIDEMKQLIQLFNPEASVADYQAIADAFCTADGWLATKK